MRRKYVITDEVKYIGDKKLHRIRAMVSFGDVKEWDKGGFVQSTANLSHSGTCWIYGDACVFDSARVSDDAIVCEGAWVYDRAKIKERAWVGGNSEVYGFTTITGDAWIGDGAVVSGRQTITE